MPKIRFKTRSLIRKFGAGPVNVDKGLAKHYVDRGQAIFVKKSMAKVKEPEETVRVEIKPR